MRRGRGPDNEKGRRPGKGEGAEARERRRGGSPDNEKGLRPGQ